MNPCKRCGGAGKTVEDGTFLGEGELVECDRCEGTGSEPSEEQVEFELGGEG